VSSPVRPAGEAATAGGAAPVAFLWHDACLRHDNGPGHPERPARLRAIRDRLERAGLLGSGPGAGGPRARPETGAGPGRLLEIEPRPCPLEAIERVHARRHIEAMREACRRAPLRLDPDTAVSEGSWDAALLSAGAALEACDAVMTGRAGAAFACTRPPGHHAEAERAMGFCMFNNVAIAAAHLKARHGLARVLIVDWDVHHGNGTQHLFEDDPAVFYFSTHQHPFYPGTGAAAERGRGRGAGATLNVPLPAGTGDEGYLRVFRETLRPEIDRFRPEFILISAGFDAHRADPLAGMSLTEAGYAEMTRLVKDAAAACCGGRIVSLLEGGYDLEALAASVEAHLLALAT
jgi:acetoin utilization deacetylase AcuC-like enzyme